jgi:hypothetical protein
VNLSERAKFEMTLIARLAEEIDKDRPNHTHWPSIDVVAYAEGTQLDDLLMQAVLGGHDVRGAVSKQIQNVVERCILLGRALEREQVELLECSSNHPQVPADPAQN